MCKIARRSSCPISSRPNGTAVVGARRPAPVRRSSFRPAWRCVPGVSTSSSRRAGPRVAPLSSPGHYQPGPGGWPTLGYWSLEAFAALEQHKVFWLSRLQRQTAVYNATGERRELLDLLETQALAMVALAVALGERQRLAARLLAVRVPQDVAEPRRRRLRAAARAKGRQVSATRLAFAAWTLFVTNGPAARLTLREALVLGRMRWQIELLFKLWKRHGRVDESRSTKPWRGFAQKVSLDDAFYGQNRTFWSRKAVRMSPESSY